MNHGRIVVVLRFLAYSLLVLIIIYHWLLLGLLLVIGALKVLFIIHEVAAVAIKELVKDSVKFPWHAILEV